MSRTARIRAAYAFLFVVAAWSCLGRLDDRRLWGDEAETALLAINITRFGVPQTRDGRNEITNLPDGRDANQDGIWTWSPWLDEYVAAASFLSFGPSTRSARLPFAILALVSVGLLARIAFKTYASHSVALVTTTLLTTCVPFLLHARQARYYALALIAQVWLIHGIALSVRKPGVRATLHVALPLAVLFYANYILALAPALAVGVFGLARIRENPATFRCLASAGAILLLLVLPWLFYAAPASQLMAIGNTPMIENALYYATEMHHHVVPWVILALPLLARAVYAVRGEAPPGAPSEGARAFEFFAWTLLGLSLVVYGLSPLRFFRYLVPLIPAIFLLSGAYLTRTIAWPGLRGVAVAVLALSNALAWATAMPFSASAHHALALPYLDLEYSIASDYDDRLDRVVEFLNENADAGDTLWSPDPEFPLIFYTELAVVDARIHPRLPAQPPNWILPVTASGVSQQTRITMPPAWTPLYDEIELEVPRSKPGGTRPDPHAHELFTEPGVETITIYRRLN